MGKQTNKNPKTPKPALGKGAVKKDKLDGAVYMNPLTDFGFKKIFGDKALLIAFVNDMINPKYPITEVQYRPTEQLGDWESERKAVYDLLCINERGEYFLVEMQRAPQEHFADRQLFYSSFLIRNQAPKGKWNYQLKAVYVISLLDFWLAEADTEVQRIVTRVSLMDEETKKRFSDKLRFIFIELPKFQKQADELESTTDIWLYCLKNLKHLKNIPSAAKKEIFQRLFEVAQIKKLTPKEMEAYQKSVLEYNDIVSALDYERRRSEARGIALGEARGIALGEARGIALGEVRGEARGIALGEARGEARMYTRFVISCAAKGMTLEEIASLTGLTAKQVQEVLQGNNQN